MTHPVIKKNHFLHFFCSSGQLTNCFFHTIAIKSCIFDTMRCWKQFWTQFEWFVFKFDQKNANARLPKTGIGKFIFNENQYTYYTVNWSLDQNLTSKLTKWHTCNLIVTIFIELKTWIQFEHKNLSFASLGPIKPL